MDKVEPTKGATLLSSNEQSPSETLGYSNNGASGATMHQQPMHRAMKYYPIAKPELDQLSQLNVFSTVFFAIGSMSVTCLIGFIWDVTNTPDGSPTSGGKLLIVASAVATVVSFGLAIGMSVWKGSKKKSILNECDSTPPGMTS